MKLTLRDVAIKANDILTAHEEGAEMDAGFDAGEWSGPAHSQMAEREIKELAEAHGFTLDEIMNDLSAWSFDQETEPGQRP